MFYKPKGQTSYDVIRSLKLRRPDLRKKSGKKIEKIGHGGSLDPFAEGVLIIGIGKEGTKQLTQFLKNSTKEYIARIVLGAVSDTYDSEGKITINNIEKLPTKKEILKALGQFQKETLQTPPPYSAIKISGQPAYKKARAGEKIALEPKKVIVYSIELLDYQPEQKYLDIKLSVGSGFYVRSLVNDLGQKLGIGAYLQELKRIKVADFTIEQTLTLKDLDEENIELNVKAEGRVQGVFFRDFCQKWANTLGLAGYAKNLPSGKEIEIIAQGTEDNLQEFLEKIKNGPPMAQVEKISHYFSKPQKKFVSFETF